MKKIYYLIATIIILISCQKLPDLGDGYGFEYNTMNDLGIYNWINKDRSAWTWEIYGAVIDYSFDSTYILAIEKPRDSIEGCRIAKNIMERKTAFKKSNFKQYWIINKKTKVRYGPFKFNEYLLKKKELNIPENLKLKTEKS